MLSLNNLLESKVKQFLTLTSIAHNYLCDLGSPGVFFFFFFPSHFYVNVYMQNRSQFQAFIYFFESFDMHKSDSRCFLENDSQSM